jgi:hypothetical protein
LSAEIVVLCSVVGDAGGRRVCLAKKVHRPRHRLGDSTSNQKSFLSLPQTSTTPL